MNKRNRDDSIEYDFKTAIFRIISLLILLIFVYSGYYFFLVDKEIKDTENLQGEFDSLQKDVSIKGSVKIFKENNTRTLSLRDFNIDKDRNLTLYFSNDKIGSELYKIEDLTFNQENLEYEVPIQLNNSIYGFILIRDSDTNEIYGYLELK